MLVGYRAGQSWLRQLTFEHIPQNILPKLLNLLNGRPLPLLKSFALTLEQGEPFRADSFLFGAPLLTTPQFFGRIEPKSAFESLTSLRLTHIAIADHRAYNSFRDGLMNIKSLQHLELQLKEFEFLSSPDPLPILLPTIQFLHVASADYCHEFINWFVASIRAPLLTTLSLNGWSEEEDEPGEAHFPLLRHLLLVNVIEGLPDLLPLAEKFPDIERLTCQLSTNNNHSPNQFSINDLFTHIVNAGREHKENRLPCPWPKLHTIATSACLVPSRTSVQHKKHKAVERLHASIMALQDNGQPIRKLLLPKSFFVKVGAEAEMGLRKVVEVEVYYDDWPMPFTGDRCAGVHSHSCFAEFYSSMAQI
ncbi:hypothetical protein FIBSPDRAFT_1047120 [Athelia psychrophila]|uniref:F-box domain-containing protein n=1 Tax=Athelia psychrophila TaxID=1759441 RepID=A0A166FNP3_9AGAM|nr:hypothetical protein FIBSPDRAFT_1047120 [Fibularhizoctonia sp. CBS 109695]